MKHVVPIQGQVQWVFRQDPVSRRFIAVCDPLGLTVEGDTYGEMVDYLQDAVSLVLGSMHKSGDFDQFLRDRGWSLVPGRVASPADLDDAQFDVPFELLSKQSHDSARRIH